MIIDFKNLPDESNIIEYKENISDGVYKTVSAMSNTDGGCIIIGVQDNTKNTVGLNSINKIQENIANTIADTSGIQPKIEHLVIDNKDILKITIEKSSNPVQYKGKYYKRVGNTSREATQEELKKLLLKDVSWDSATNNCTMDDIDEKTIIQFVKNAVKKDRIIQEASNYTPEEVLNHLDLISNGKLTNGAILLFGKNPQKLFKHATIRIGLFKDNSEDTIIGDKEISGNLFNQIQEVESALKSFINKKSSVKDFNRIDVWEYPIVALREATLNALIHREYNDNSSNTQIKIFKDNVWFYNTGELFGGLTLEILKSPHHPSKSRNPLIMNVIYRAGYVEQFGTGIKRMTSACLKQGIPSPKLAMESCGFVLTMNKHYPNINERQQKAIEYVVENELITNSEYQTINNISRETSKRDLKKLVDMGIFDTLKEKSSTFYKLKI